MLSTTPNECNWQFAQSPPPLAILPYLASVAVQAEEDRRCRQVEQAAGSDPHPS